MEIIPSLNSHSNQSGLIKSWIISVLTHVSYANFLIPQYETNVGVHSIFLIENNSEH